MSEAEVANSAYFNIVEILRKAHLDSMNTIHQKRTSDTYTLLSICAPAADEIERLRVVARRVDAIRAWLDDTNDLGMHAVAKLYELLEVPCEVSGCTLTMEHIEAHNNEPHESVTQSASG